MREFLKIWLTIISLAVGVVAVLTIGVVLFILSTAAGLIYIFLLITGLFAAMIYHDLHRYD